MHRPSAAESLPRRSPSAKRLRALNHRRLHQRAPDPRARCGTVTSLGHRVHPRKVVGERRRDVRNRGEYGTVGKSADAGHGFEANTFAFGIWVVEFWGQ